MDKQQIITNILSAAALEHSYKLIAALDTRSYPQLESLNSNIRRLNAQPALWIEPFSVKGANTRERVTNVGRLYISIVNALYGASMPREHRRQEAQSLYEQAASYRSTQAADVIKAQQKAQHSLIAQAAIGSITMPPQTDNTERLTSVLSDVSATDTPTDTQTLKTA